MRVKPSERLHLHFEPELGWLGHGARDGVQQLLPQSFQTPIKRALYSFDDIFWVVSSQQLANNGQAGLSEDIGDDLRHVEPAFDESPFDHVLMLGPVLHVVLPHTGQLPYLFVLFSGGAYCGG
jgi:hypothetical protein